MNLLYVGSLFCKKTLIFRNISVFYGCFQGFVVVIGNEANGVRKDIVERSNKELKIPMPGKAESLNAGVAASIIMYEAMRSRN